MRSHPSPLGVGVATCLLLMAAGWLAPPTLVAQSQRSNWGLRSAGASAFMLSKDQRSWLQYDRPGILLDLQLAYTLSPWFDLQFGATGGLFLAEQPGGLAAPVLGVLGRLPGLPVVPYAMIDLGIGFTGSILRPFSRLGAGVEFPITEQLRLGPSVGLGLVTQWNNPDYSSSALYAWAGLSVTYGTLPTLAAPSRKPQPKAAKSTPPPPPAADEPILPSEPEVAPSHELENLLERALPVERSELLAPVLFGYNSDELDPTGVAMLHEVARVLSHERHDIELLAIAGYADARGDETENKRLARRRAERVCEWLIAHGIAAERLQVDPEGAIDFVESGSAEESHMQNRRVVFRVLRTRRR